MLPHISVCICTYRRPKLLQYLLEKLRSQEVNGQFGFSVVVTDNDRLKSAAGVVSEFRSCGIEITYSVEPEQNIALARNRALANAKGDFIAFIDDDEFPANDWLLKLFQTCRTHAVAGVLGPVIPYFEQDPPEWVIKGKFNDRPRHETGFKIEWNEGRTGNLLFKREILDGMNPVFLPEFGSGGEDRNFFQRVTEDGHRFVWCNEAVAYEWVPAIRWKRTFMVRRALLRGKMALNHRRGLGDLAKSLVALVGYGLALPVFLVIGHHFFMKYLIRACDHAGKLLAFANINPVREKYVTE
jgi:succinoglycan biosynthesis protein ExoM